MNDFSELERQLENLRPAQPSSQLTERVEKALRDPVIIQPDRLNEGNTIERRFFESPYHIGWILAAAAAILIFFSIDLRKTTRQPQELARSPMAPANSPAARNLATFLPAGATQVVYHTQDEGLFFPAHSERPLRKVRSVTHETLQWRNAATGASLRVSYPTERVDLIPVWGQ